ncbi:Protein FAF-like [Actinidia chinensis var. chinensis]|uniref:Protein FAF-like n=1 Tax=Actinidia chinensis var. chinensis TaxID=1590841 RepID=A0A2R6R311_ACTCC|nr:Protein FAF-like [Actinidia chinensis var. chinensis]
MPILLSLAHLFTIMLNFCMKSVRSLLGFVNSTNHENLITPHHSRNIPSPATGLASATSSDNTRKSANVVESAAIKPTPSTTEAAAAKHPPFAAARRKDPGGIGFLDEVGGSVDGLTSCTESLGFESSDERLTGGETSSRTTSKKRRRVVEYKADEAKTFPPPLSSLSRNGKLTFFLLPVRRDGRLELTEVKIDRQEVLRASREDGRLRLSLITDVDVEDQEETEDTTTVMEEDEREEDREEEEEIGEKWVFTVANGDEEGFRQCHEMANHHHHILPAWSQHCVTIR